MLARTWYESATSSWRDWHAATLVEAKGDNSIAVVMPARNEAPTICGIVAGIRTELCERIGLVDEVVVIDSDSTDDTAQMARDGGATVFAAASIRPDLGSYAGKGEALWKSLFVTDADILVFIDADLTEWGPHFVSGLLGPILTDAGVHLVKGFYDRISDDGTGRVAPQGGRVTELVARPFLNLRWPELARVVQPLAGEWAIRRAVLDTLPVPVGYGVEIATLLDIYTAHGLGAIAQVDLGERAHSHQSVHDLGLMAAEILTIAARRAGWAGIAAQSEPVLWQFSRNTDPRWVGRHIPTAERPPAISVGQPTC
ncbi:MAG: glucosyl-3-phosphoglycerate synthase [Actinomycetota bacterium]|nr:glucosyl-3-phosphoglycerate synthase [Actinomycetota bacterium]